MKDIKYIIKRIVIGVGIFIAIYFLKTNVFALDVASYNGVQYSDTYFIDNAILVADSDFDFSEYSNIMYINNVGNPVSPNTATYYMTILAFKDISSGVKFSSYNSNRGIKLNITSPISSSNPLDFFCVTYNYQTNTIYNNNNNHCLLKDWYIIGWNISNGSYYGYLTSSPSDFLTARSTSGIASNNRYYTNFPITLDLSTNESNYNSLSSQTGANWNTLDFTSYLSTLYMTLTTFDNSLVSIDNVSCTDNTQDYCTITPTQNTRYLRVSYSVPEFLGQRLDILNNQIMQSNTKIKSINPYVSAKQVYLEYYFNDSTSNVSNNMYFVNGSSSYNASNQLYNFISSFKQNDDYSSVSLYRFDIYYDLGGVYYNGDLSVPYYLTFKTITSGGSGTTDNTNEEQQQQQIDQNQIIIDNLDDINNSINNSNVDGAKSDYGNFFIEFNSPDHGNLSTIITVPLRAINTITTNTCRDLVIPVPNTGKNITLPCLKPIYQEKVPVLLGLWNLVILGLVSYRVLTSLFLHIKDLHDPTQDKIEVLDL